MKPLIQSPHDPDFIQDPYALYARVLADDPVQYWQDYGQVAIFDPGLIHALLRDRRLGRAHPGGRPAAPDHLHDFERAEQFSMLDLEPPSHTRLRGLVLRAFTSRRIRALVPDMHEICDSLIAAFPQDDPFDVLPAYCAQVPVRIIARLLGVPEDMSDQLLRWSNTMVAMYQAGRTHATELAANQAAAEFAQFLRAHIEKRRQTPDDDLITHLIAAEQDGETLSMDEMISTCILLLNAGHEATVHSLGNGVKALLEAGCDPQWLSAQGIERTVEEILRYDPPLHIFTRYAYEDLSVNGHMIAAGAQIALVLGAAGMQPGGPRRFAPGAAKTAAQSHAAFGGGLHFCVGAPLARLEMGIALQKLFAAHPGLSLCAAPRYGDTYHFHGLTSLIVTCPDARSPQISSVQARGSRRAAEK
jgi:unspecific monooxygenase